MDFCEKQFTKRKPLVINKDPKLTYGVQKFLMKKAYKFVRTQMGGKSKDISTREISIKDEIINGYEDPITVRVYKPVEEKIRPVMVFCHGGGWVGGTIDVTHDYCKAVSDFADCVVVSVDYHLAPEKKYPVGLEDAYAAIKWTLNNKERLQIDEKQLIVSGDSAGGNLSVALCFMAHDRQEFEIAKQILLYPAVSIDHTNSKYKIEKNLLLDGFSELYLPSEDLRGARYISPFAQPNLENLPPVLITVGTHDFLFNQVFRFAKRLDEAGNSVRFVLYKNIDHAFVDNTGYCPYAEDFIKEVSRFINN